MSLCLAVAPIYLDSWLEGGQANSQFWQPVELRSQLGGAVKWNVAEPVDDRNQSSSWEGLGKAKYYITYLLSTTAQNEASQCPQTN